jgi:hypothetical protein
MVERQTSPYRGILIGEKRRLSEIQEKVPYVKPALDAFMNDGRVIGQSTLDNDVLLWSPEGVERKRVERERAEAGHRLKEVIAMERNRPQPEYIQTHLQGMEDIETFRPNIPYEFLGVTGLEQTIFKSDTKNPVEEKRPSIDPIK